jgi:hypothetical protein
MYKETLPYSLVLRKKGAEKEKEKEEGQSEREREREGSLVNSRLISNEAWCKIIICVQEKGGSFDVDE